MKFLDGQKIIYRGRQHLTVDSPHNHFTTAMAIIFCGVEERNRGYALLMTANNSDTVLYRASTFSLLPAPHGGISSWNILVASLPDSSLPLSNHWPPCNVLLSVWSIGHPYLERYLVRTASKPDRNGLIHIDVHLHC